jgi:hypothetical protein
MILRFDSSTKIDFNNAESGPFLGKIRSQITIFFNVNQGPTEGDLLA